jgi:hypothetical protein
MFPYHGKTKPTLLPKLPVIRLPYMDSNTIFEKINLLLSSDSEMLDRLRDLSHDLKPYTMDPFQTLLKESNQTNRSHDFTALGFFFSFVGI